MTHSVPLHTEDVFKPRMTRYCLVVPVINEGKKIIDQLSAMQMLGFMQIVDVVIADGGSTDGSMRPSFLCDHEVRALLTKTDKGKLSAQLRMAYSFALKEGYEGIITIDGNGKDSIESIPIFINALDEGTDYAQASRFINGGRGINTPLFREFAVRLIHSPILSLAAGKRFTDTTQGFRAYSKRYLEDPRVLPFRDVFNTYELLSYLTVRANQLGYCSKEIPTTRTYPGRGKVPTKISVMGNLSLIFILFKTIMGLYKPPRKS